MANSKYEYVKREFEFDPCLPPSNWIVVRIDGCHFHRFSKIHAFKKPNDENALRLMNACATAVLKKFPDIVFAYGASDEYSFIFREETEFYHRRESKILSLCVSYFTSVYVMKWKDFFPNKELKEPPYFDARAVCYPNLKTIRDYLAWRQVDCHINNQYNTCFWMLVKSGKSEQEAQLALKGTFAKDKNELLAQQFQINYDDEPAMFRKGSSVYREKEETTVKIDDYEQRWSYPSRRVGQLPQLPPEPPAGAACFQLLAAVCRRLLLMVLPHLKFWASSGTDYGDPIKRPRLKVTVAHVDIIGPEFWENHQHILREGKISNWVVKKSGINHILSPHNWIVVRINACQFDQFSTIHSFDKPNDEAALSLMNESASLMMKQYPDIVFAYGFSSEYSFVFHEKTELYQRRESLILSSCSSYFTSLYMTKWKEFFPHKELVQTPHFEAEALCYPKLKIVCEYLSWRQAECHTGNQYNTCFWMLVKSGKGEKESHEILKGTLSKDKNELLFQQFQMNYNNEPAMFRKGSCIYRRKVEGLAGAEDGDNDTTRERSHVKVDHVDLGPGFWRNQPWIMTSSS